MIVNVRNLVLLSTTNALDTLKCLDEPPKKDVFVMLGVENGYTGSIEKIVF